MAPGAIVTITGPGGVGKTRLASDWADRTAGDIAGGARVVSLAGDIDSEATPARALRAIGDDGTSQRVIRTVHGRGYIFVAEVMTA